MKREVKKAAKKAAKRKPAQKLPTEEQLGSDGLTTKQRMFVEAYLSNGFNATEAARMAGYQGNDVTLAAVGYENLRKPQIATVVSARINEAAMSANEVMSRLSDIARGKVTDFVDDEGKFDLKQAKKAKKDGLLKKLKTKRTSKKVDAFTEGEEEEKETIETSLVYEEVEFEMYSAHEALRDLGKYHRLFGERSETLSLNLTPEQLAELTEPEIDALIAKLSRKR